MARSPTLAGHRPLSISILSSHEFFFSSFGLNSFAAQVGGTFWFSPPARTKAALTAGIKDGADRDRRDACRRRKLPRDSKNERRVSLEKGSAWA